MSDDFDKIIPSYMSILNLAELGKTCVDDEFHGRKTRRKSSMMRPENGSGFSIPVNAISLRTGPTYFGKQYV